jgi:Cu-Zn family superoxide dismutase
MRITTQILCGVVLLGACTHTPRVNVDPDRGAVDVDVQRVGTAEEWDGTLAPRNGATVGGSFTVHVTDEMSHARVNLTGGTAGATHPWHIHDGTCATGGPIVGMASAYPPLRPGQDGRAAAEAHLSNVELNEAKQYHVNVHASPTEMGTIIGCGDLDD